jgi:Fe-S oxidoreductase
LPQEERRRSVIVVQDAFTTHYDAEVVVDLLELLQRLGFRPWLAPFRANGKPQHVLGFLGRFGRTAAANAQMLRELAGTGIELVGVDPSMTLTYRAEYAKALGKDAVPAVALPQEWLARRLPGLRPLATSAREEWALLPHCTEKTNAPAAANAWVEVCRWFGVDLTVPAAGCCGMSGVFGHERANRPASEAIYRLSWTRIVGEPRHRGRLLATGYSCRCQAELVDGVRLPHPVQMLLQVARQGAVARQEETSLPPVECIERHEEV